MAISTKSKKHTNQMIASHMCKLLWLTSIQGAFEHIIESKVCKVSTEIEQLQMPLEQLLKSKLHFVLQKVSPANADRSVKFSF